MNIEKIKERIYFLHTEAHREKEVINENSLKSFWSFIEWLDEYGNFTMEPLVGLTPNNNMYLSWREGNRFHSFYFRDNGQIKYVSHNFLRRNK